MYQNLPYRKWNKWGVKNSVCLPIFFGTNVRPYDNFVNTIKPMNVFNFFFFKKETKQKYHLTPRTWFKRILHSICVRCTNIKAQNSHAKQQEGRHSILLMLLVVAADIFCFSLASHQFQSSTTQLWYFHSCWCTKTRIHHMSYIWNKYLHYQNIDGNTLKINDAKKSNLMNTGFSWMFHDSYGFVINQCRIEPQLMWIERTNEWMNKKQNNNNKQCQFDVFVFQ